MADIMSIQKFIADIFSTKTRNAFPGAENRSFAAKPAGTVSAPAVTVYCFIVESSAKGYLPETTRTKTVSLQEAIDLVTTIVDANPSDFLDISNKEMAAGIRPARVQITDNATGESFAYLRACDEDMKLVHCLPSSMTFAGRTAMPFIPSDYRYAKEFKGAGAFSSAAYEDSFSDSDAEFAVFATWKGMYPGHVSY